MDLIFQQKDKKKDFNNTVFQHFVSDLRSHSTLKTLFSTLVHGVPIGLKWRANMFFNYNSIFKRNLKLILCACTFRQNLYLKKIVKICSSLTWRQSQKCKICVRISETNILPQLLLRSSHAGTFPKYIHPQKQPSRYIFQYRCSATVVRFFEKYLWWSAIFSKFPRNTLQLGTNAAEKLYFNTALINA